MTWAAIGRAIWTKVRPLAAALGLLVCFGLGSWAVSLLLAGVMGETHAIAGIPWIVVAASVAFVALIIFRRALPPVPVHALGQREYREDGGWYDARWRRDPDNPAHDLGTAGYRLELHGGPLAGRTARLRDSRFRLWVIEAADGSHAVTGTIAPPEAMPAGARLLGSYGFSHGAEAMTWEPVTPR